MTMAEFEQVKRTLSNAVTVICKNNVTFATSLHIEGVIGLTVDGNKMCVIHMDDTVPAVADQVPAAGWPQRLIGTVGSNEEASLAVRNVEYAEFLNAMLNQAENEVVSCTQMSTASCGHVIPNPGEFNRDLVDGGSAQRIGSADMMTNVPQNSMPFVLCKRIEGNVPKVHDCPSETMDYGQGVATSVAGKKQPGAARTKKSGVRPMGTVQGYGRKSADRIDYKKDVKIAKKKASMAIKRDAANVMQPSVAEFQALQQPNEVNTPSKKKTSTLPVVMAQVSGEGFSAGKATTVGAVKVDEMITAEAEMKEPWGAFNQSPGRGRGRGKCGSNRSPKKQSNMTSAQSPSAPMSLDCSPSDQTDMYVTKVTSYVCGYMDCGATFTQKRTLLAHLTAKHGRQPKFVRGRFGIDSHPETWPSNASYDY